MNSKANLFLKNMKLTKRKGFNFFRSYFDVYNELDNPEDKVAFIDALLDRQFLGVKPEGLKGMSKFAYISQTNSIDSQVKGYEDKTKTRLLTDPTEGVNEKQINPTVQVEEKGKEQYINNKIYLNTILKDQYWLETTCMQSKHNLDTVIKYLEIYERRLIQTSEQKNTIKDFKTHFTNWFNLQNVQKIVKHKKIDYGNPNG